MEQILTTAALMLGGIFAVWILFSDTLGDDGKSGQMDTTLLVAFLMIPLIIAVLIGIVLFLPILLGIILVLFVAYGAYLGIKWLLTRERGEGRKVQERREGKEGRMQKTFRAVRASVSSAWNSRPSRALRQRTKEATVTFHKTVKEKGGRLKTKVSERMRKVVRKSAEEKIAGKHSKRRKRRSAVSHAKQSRTSDQETFIDASDEGVSLQPSGSGSSEHRRSADGEKTSKKKHAEDHAFSSETQFEQDAPPKNKKARISERAHSHDALRNMRKIGWSTRRHLGEVYHHRRKGK